LSEEVSNKSQSFEQGDIGRGYLWITGAKLWFLVTATLLNIGLPRLLGDPALFGMYKVVAGFLAVISMVILSGSLQTASKAISENPGQAGATRRRAQRLAFTLSGGLAIVMFLGADLIAEHLWQDPALAAPLRVASVIVAGYGLYATWIGVANGLKRYRTQALFDIGFATLKTASIIALVVLGYGVLGVFGAFAGVTILMTFAAFWFIARKTPARSAAEDSSKAQGGLAGRQMVFFMFGVMGFNLTLNLLLQGDVVLLKGLIHGLTERSVLGDPDGLATKLLPMMTGGHTHDISQAVQSSTSALTGVYGAVRTVTMIPYQGIISLTFVVFPLLSEATFQADREKTERTVRGALRFSVLLVGFLCGGLVLTDNVLIGILFGAPYQGGAIFLVPMVAGTVSFALYVVITSTDRGGPPGSCFGHWCSLRCDPRGSVCVRDPSWSESI